MPETKRVNQLKIGWLLCVCLLFSVTVGLFAPVETYLAMTDSLWFSIVDLLPVALVVTVALLALTFGAGLLTRGRLRCVYMALLVAVSALLYLQSQFVNADYGVLNGTPIAWDTFGAYPVWNTLLWAAVVLLLTGAALCMGRRIGAPLRFAAVLMLVLQVVSVGVLGLTTGVADKKNAGYVVCDNEFNFSKNKNVIVMGVDSFTPQLFDELYGLYPEAFADWTGFVEFPNSTAQFTATYFAVGNMLTGIPYDMSVSADTYSANAIRDGDFLPTLAANGYQMECYYEEEVPAAYAEYFANCRLGTAHVTDFVTLCKKMYRLTAFRYAPHILKPYFWMDSADFSDIERGAPSVGDTDEELYTRKDDEFRQRFDRKGVTVDMEQNCFRLYLMYGPHRPYLLATPTTRLTEYAVVSQHTQTMNALDTVSAIFRALKEAGVYDDAVIIVTADHGDGPMDYSPFLLVKKPGAQGAITQNKSLVNQNDLQATVYALAGIDATSDIGMNVFDVGDLKRTFTYHYLPFISDSLYRYDLTQLSDGTLHYEQQPTFGTEYGEQPVRPYPVKLGERFGPGETLSLMDAMDYYHTREQKERIWLCQTSGVTFRVTLDDIPKGGVSLVLDVDAVMGDGQRVVVARGETVYETFTATPDTKRLEITVPPECIENGQLVLELRFPDAISEYKLNGFENATDSVYPQAIAVKSVAFEAQ